MNTTLIIMAAGIGSRFGTGIKQLAKMAPNGEIIMDFSIYDAKEAGFTKVVFVIRKAIEKEFKEVETDCLRSCRSNMFIRSWRICQKDMRFQRGV